MATKNGPFQKVPVIKGAGATKTTIKGGGGKRAGSGIGKSPNHKKSH